MRNSLFLRGEHSETYEQEAKRATKEGDHADVSDARSASMAGSAAADWVAVRVMSTTQLLSPMPRHDVTSMAAGSANRASTRANAAL